MALGFCAVSLSITQSDHGVSFLGCPILGRLWDCSIVANQQTALVPTCMDVLTLADDQLMKFDQLLLTL